VKQLEIDQASGTLYPFYDPDCSILYLAGKVTLIKKIFQDSLNFFFFREMVTFDTTNLLMEICIIAWITRPLSREEVMGFIQRDVSMSANAN
jgi:hypothetical protein